MESYIADNKNISPEQALHLARIAQPHNHIITNHTTPTLRICALGCHGDKSGISKEVMKCLNEIITKNPKLKPDIILILGDNYYPDGLPSPNHPRVQTQFYEVFANENLDNIRDIPCIIILGNHDSGQDILSEVKSYIPYKTSVLGANPHRFEEAELQQVAHTYLKNPDAFNEKELDYTKLPKHCMPSCFHSWEFDTVLLIGLNTNTYAKDFLQMMKSFANDEFIDTKNQAVWLKEKYMKARENGKSIIFATHHPFYTCGKRYYSSDWDASHYLSAQEITLLQNILQLDQSAKDFKEKLKILFLEEFSYSEKNTRNNELLAKIICQFQKLSPDLICSAHDHSMYYYNNKIVSDLTAPFAEAQQTYRAKGLTNICQVVSGGGGSSDLQTQLYFGENCHFIKDNGFTLISCNKNNPHLFLIDVHTLNWVEYLKSTDKDITTPQLAFTSQSDEPFRSKELSDELVSIRKCVLEACLTYQKFIHEKQGTKGDFFLSLKSIFSISSLFNYNNKHKLEDLDLMHEILGFFKNPVPFDYITTIKFLSKKLNGMLNKDSENSLYRDMRERLKPVLKGKSLEELEAELSPNFNI